VLVVSPALGVRTVKELVAGDGEAKPGSLTTRPRASAAPRTSAPRSSAWRRRHRRGARADEGSPESLTETIAGRTQFTWTPLSTAAGQIKEGRLLALAVSTPRRVPAFPDVPTIAEAGYPKGEFNFWVGMLAPAQTPRDIVGRLNAEINKVLQSAEMKERLAGLGAEPMQMTPEQYDAFLREEYSVLGEVMRASGVKAQ
jgi:tripartite-type tricarboxylate transporter receptor subunit TctC